MQRQEPVLRVEDLSGATIHALNQHLDLDFAKFGYKKRQGQSGDGAVVARGKLPEGRAALAQLQLVDIPFNGGQLLTRAAARAGIVWGACHYDDFDEWECSKDQSGIFREIGKYQGSLHEGQMPWLNQPYRHLRSVHQIAGS